MNRVPHTHMMPWYMPLPLPALYPRRGVPEVRGQ